MQKKVLALFSKYTGFFFIKTTGLRKQQNSSQCLFFFVCNRAHISLKDKAEWEIEAKRKEYETLFDVQWLIYIMQSTIHP